MNRACIIGWWNQGYEKRSDKQNVGVFRAAKVLRQPIENLCPFRYQTERPKSCQQEEKVLQKLEGEFVATQRQDRLALETSTIDSFQSSDYLVVRIVTRKLRRTRTGALREPGSVLLGPFGNESQVRFIQTSAQALGLTVERADAWREQPVRGWHGSEQRSVGRSPPTPIDHFHHFDLALNGRHVIACPTR